MGGVRTDGIKNLREYESGDQVIREDQYES